MSLEKIDFFTSDTYYKHLDLIACEIANFLFQHRSQLFLFKELMRLSAKWTKADYKKLLEQWIASKKGRKKTFASDTLGLFEYSNKFFSVCKNDNEILKMRGLVPEKIVEKIFNERYSGKICRMGYGKGVEIEGKRIVYTCASPYSKDGDSDRNRQSVDAGVWDGNKGEFVEVKFNPEAFHTKDINYLRLLILELKESQCDHIIYLISMGNKKLTEERLISLNILENSEFRLIGGEELFELKSVV